MELRPERRLDALPCLVLGPEVIAERLDDVVGGHTEVRGSLLDHRQYRVQHTDDRREGFVFTLGGTALAVELAEQLVGAVQEMNDHAPRPHAAARSSSSVRSRVLRVSAAARSMIWSST